MSTDTVLSAEPVDDRIAPGIRLGVVRGITYGQLSAPETFLPQARGVGAGIVRVFLYWAQVEPEPGRYVWDTVDALLAQLDGDEEVWVTVSSSSMWATRRATDLLPPSPAHDPATFGAFVHRLVAHCAGRVRYWQCDNEPSVPILWAGTAEDYVTQFRVFSRAVRDADPGALVVLGGAPPSAVGPEAEQRDHDVFRHIVEHTGADFDVFDVHLYGDPYAIGERIAACRALLAEAGYPKPVVAGEYNGPVPFELPEVAPELGPIWASANSVPTDDAWIERVADVDRPGPEYDAMVALYERMATLPPQLQMFMADCPPEAADRRHRWNCRDLVIRNVLALAAGVRRTLCWNLGPEAPETSDPYQIFGLLFDKFRLMDYRDGVLTHRYPAADTLALTSRMLADATTVRRRELPGYPEVFAFDVARGERGALLVVWERRDGFTGEKQPPTPFELAWTGAAARAVDAFGEPVPVRVQGGRIHLPVSGTPVFVEEAADSRG